MKRAPAFLLLLLAAGCPKTPPKLSAPPPAGTGGPIVAQLEERNARLRTLQAEATIRVKSPDQSGKVHAAVVASNGAVRIDVSLPLMAGPTVLIANGELQIYDPGANVLQKAPLEAMAQGSSLLPLPMSAVPALVRGALPLASGVAMVVAPMFVDSAFAGHPIAAIEVHDAAGVRQRVTLDRDGGYPLRDERFDAAGAAVWKVDYLDYAGAETSAGTIAFPQHLHATTPQATVDVQLRGIVLNRPVPPDSFVLRFGNRPPRVEDIR